MLVAAQSWADAGAPLSGVVLTGEVVREELGAAGAYRLVTISTIVDDAGQRHVVRQVGGSMDGIGMTQLHGPTLLRPGMVVTVRASGVEATSSAKMSAKTSATNAGWLLDATVHNPDRFVRSGPTARGNALYWESGCVYVGIAGDGTAAVNDEDQAIIRSMTEWNDRTESCSFQTLMWQDNLTAEVGIDRVNVIRFRDNVWCHSGTVDCYSPSAAGLTTLSFIDDADSARDGAIIDADIEFNGVQFAPSINGMSSADPMCQADIENTMTHELGHLLGFEHTCVVATDPPRVDDQGNDVPRCSANNPAAIRDATMYAYQDCGETSKQSLSADDVAAMCSTYPKSDNPGTCATPDDLGGCCQSGAPPSVGGLMLAALAWLGLRRRTAQSRTV